MSDALGTTEALPVFDLDTGAGSDLHPVIGLMFADAGGHKLVSDADPLPVVTSGSGGAAGTANADADADFAEALVGLLTNSRLGIHDEVTADYARIDGLKDGVAGAYVLQPRESAFPATRLGRRFVATHQTLGATITGQTAISATTPTFMMRQAASSRRIILRSITLTSVQDIGDEMRVLIVLDQNDRLSAGGTPHVPQNVNEESAVASALTAFLSNPTATAAGAGTRVIGSYALDLSPKAATISIDLKDGVILGTTGSILVYAYVPGGTAPTLFFVFEWEEVS